MNGRPLTLDDEHRLALSIAVGSWRDATSSLRIILGQVLADDPEAVELSGLLDALDRRLFGLREDYAKPATS